MLKKSLISILLLIVFAGCSPKAPSAPPVAYNPQTLRVFSTYPGFNYLPFYSWLEGDQPVGFEPELAKLVAEQLRMKVAFVYPREASKQDPRLYALNNNIADIALFSFPRTKFTKKLAGLSKPYASDGIGILVAANSSISSASDLSNKRLLAFQHTAANSWARRRFPHAEILPNYPEGNEGDVLELLEDDIVDAFLIGREHLRWVSKESSSVKLLEEQRSNEFFSIAVQKNNSRLLQRINMALQALEANGKLQQLRKKWNLSWQRPAHKLR